MVGQHFTVVTNHASLQWMAKAKDTNSRVTLRFISLQECGWPVTMSHHVLPAAHISKLKARGSTMMARPAPLPFRSIFPLLPLLQNRCWTDSIISSPPVFWTARKHMAMETKNPAANQSCATNSSPSWSRRESEYVKYIHILYVTKQTFVNNMVNQF